MKKLLWVIAALLMVNIGNVFAEDAPEFTANMVAHLGADAPANKVYVSRNYIRLEMPQGNYAIVDVRAKITHVVLPKEEKYMDFPADVFRMPRYGKMLGTEIKRVSLGKQKISGYDTEQFLVTRDIGAKMSENMIQWLRSDNIAVKLASGDENWSVTLSDIVPGKQNDSLFGIPYTYKGYDQYGHELR